jgi:predicted nucleic acid-binding protein
VIVVLDANVLYPPSLRDLLLTLAALDAFHVRWSDEILDEVSRNVLADNPDVDPAKFVEHTIGSMRRAFPDTVVTVDHDLIDRLDNDPKDRHVAAAALSCEAQAIVTINVADFDSAMLREKQVEILAPGELVQRLLDDVPEVVVMAVDRLASRWKNPPRSPAEIVDLLSAHPSMAAPMAQVRSLLDG